MEKTPFPLGLTHDPVDGLVELVVDVKVRSGPVTGGLISPHPTLKICVYRDRP